MIRIFIATWFAAAYSVLIFPNDPLLAPFAFVLVFLLVRYLLDPPGLTDEETQTDTLPDEPVLETCRFCGFDFESPCEAPPPAECEQAINASFGATRSARPAPPPPPPNRDGWGREVKDKDD